MATAAPQRMTVAEFLEWDDGTDTRYELVRGQIVATAPPAERHGTIVINLGRHLANHLTPPCRAVGQAGIVPPRSGRHPLRGRLGRHLRAARPRPPARRTPC